MYPVDNFRHCTNMNNLSVFSCKPAHDSLHRMGVPFAVDCTGNIAARKCQSVSHQVPGGDDIAWQILKSLQLSGPR